MAVLNDLNPIKIEPQKGGMSHPFGQNLSGTHTDSIYTLYIHCI